MNKEKIRGLRVGELDRDPFISRGLYFENAGCYIDAGEGNPFNRLTSGNFSGYNQMRVIKYSEDENNKDGKIM